MARVLTDAEAAAVFATPEGRARATRALIRDAREEVATATRVGVLKALGYHKSEIATALGVSVYEVNRAVERLQRVADRIEA